MKQALIIIIIFNIVVTLHIIVFNFYVLNKCSKRNF